MTVLAVAALALAGCDTFDDSGVHPMGPPPTPSAATMAEARQIDHAQELLEDGQFGQARTALDALIAKGCTHPSVLMLEARLEFDQGEFETSVRWAQQAIDASPLWIEPRVLQAQAHLKLTQYAAAEGIFRDIDGMAPDSPWGPCGIGEVAAMQGDTKTAIAELDLALKRDPRHAPSLESRAGVARLVGDRVGEERFLQRYVVEQPLEADAFERLGELAQGFGRREDARRAYERAYSLEATPAPARALAELAALRGDEVEEHKWKRLAGMKPAPADHPKDQATR